MFHGGPFRGVVDTTEPYDDGEDILTVATNGYLPDPARGCAFYSRPGITVNTSQLGGGSRIGQGVHCHLSGDGTSYNFMVIGGLLYRSTSGFVATAVTPTNIAISTGRLV